MRGAVRPGAPGAAPPTLFEGLRATAARAARAGPGTGGDDKADRPSLPVG
jgi:hypothetical protein